MLDGQTECNRIEGPRFPLLACYFHVTWISSAASVPIYGGAHGNSTSHLQMHTLTCASQLPPTSMPTTSPWKWVLWTIPAISHVCLPDSDECHCPLTWKLHLAFLLLDEWLPHLDHQECEPPGAYRQMWVEVTPGKWQPDWKGMWGSHGTHRFTLQSWAPTVQQAPFKALGL